MKKIISIPLLSLTILALVSLVAIAGTTDVIKKSGNPEVIVEHGTQSVTPNGSDTPTINITGPNISISNGSRTISIKGINVSSPPDGIVLPSKETNAVFHSNSGLNNRPVVPPEPAVPPGPANPTRPVVPPHPVAPPETVIPPKPAVPPGPADPTRPVVPPNPNTPN